jgi:hypothetical protein
LSGSAHSWGNEILLLLLVIIFGALFLVCLIAESVTSWIVIKGSKKHHPTLWIHSGYPTLMGNGDLISVYPLVRYYWRRQYAELRDEKALAFADKWRLPTVLSYTLTWVSAVVMLVGIMFLPSD